MRHPSSRTPASAAYSEGEGGSRLVVVHCRRSLIRVLPPDLSPQDRACNLRERLPLETAGDRCEPLGSDGVDQTWTKPGVEAGTRSHLVADRRRGGKLGKPPFNRPEMRQLDACSDRLRNATVLAFVVH